MINICYPIEFVIFKVDIKKKILISQINTERQIYYIYIFVSVNLGKISGRSKSKVCALFDLKHVKDGFSAMFKKRAGKFRK